jgi:transcriptional regulator with PAS, ATPase and Fis domain
VSQSCRVNCVDLAPGSIWPASTKESPQAAVLLRGENGTGKSVLARSLHRLSSRSEKPFVTASAPTLPD